MKNSDKYNKEKQKEIEYLIMKLNEHSISIDLLNDVQKDLLIYYYNNQLNMKKEQFKKIKNEIIKKRKDIMVVKKAGCILIDLNTKKIALICRNGKFSFPKGHLEKNENINECAIRETIEETGHECHLIENKEIAKINYLSSNGENVENYMFIAISDGKSKKHINNKDKEMTVWKNFNEIETTLSHKNLIEFWNNIKYKVKEILDNE